MRMSPVARLPLASCVAALLVAAPLAAQPPAHLGYQGRLLKADGSAETGVVDVTFKLFDSENGGQPLWTEAQKLALTDGFYATFLGDVQRIPAGVIDGDRWLELTINGEPLLPRQKLGSVAFALSASDARNVTGGSVDASSISVAGRQVVDSGGQLKAEAGAAFALKQHQHDAAEIASGVFSLDRIPHAGLDADLLDGQDSSAFLKKSDPLDWAKLKGIPPGLADGTDDGLTAVRHDATLTGDGANDALGINPAAVQARVSGSCGSGFVLRAINQDGTVTCAPDADSGGTVTGVTATGPLVSSGGKTPQISLTTRCATSQILKWTGLDWVCANDDDAGGTVTGVTATGPLASTGGRTPTISIAQASGTASGYLSSTDWTTFNGKVASVGVTGPLATTGGTTPTLSLNGCAGGQILKWNGSAWACAADDDTQYAVATGGGLALNGARFSLLSGCAAGELLKWSGAQWVCAPDEDAGGTVTDVRATGPLASTGGRTPTISIAQASGVASGYLSATDWTTFNGKVASVSASGPLSSTGGTTPSIALTGVVGTSNGGTGINAAPTSAGQFLKSTGSGTWGIGTLAASDIPSLSATYADLASNQTVGGTKTFANTIVGSVSGNAGTVTNGVYTTGSYANPSWITALAGSKITGTVATAATATNFTGALDGEVTGTQGATKVVGLLGQPIASLPLGDGQVLKYNGLNQRWEPAIDNDSGGRVYSVSANGPLSVAGITLPTISIAQAGTSADGYLSASDWNRFNAKVASVSASGPLTSTGGATPTLGLAGCGSGELLKWTGSAWACAADQIGSGTVTSITAGTGLAGGTITASGTLSIASNGVSSTQLASDALSLAKVSGGTMASNGGSIGIGTTSPAATLDVRGNVLLEAGGSPTLYTGTGTTELNRYLQLVNAPGAQSGSGLKAAGVLVADSYAYASPGKNDLVVKGNVGVGVASPGAKVDVAGDVRVSGRVLTPNKPWFIAGDNRDWLSSQGWTAVNYNTVLKGNAGGWYDPTSGKFTAPVSGLYLCHSSHYIYPTTSGASYIHHTMGCNGQADGGCGMGYSAEYSIFGLKASAEGPYGSNTEITRFAFLNAGDYLQVYVYVSELAQYTLGRYSTFSCVLMN